MAASALLGLIEYNYAKEPRWNMDEKAFSSGDFTDAVKEYCYAFWQLGTPTAYESFYRVSSEMLIRNPKDVGFIDNLGSYWQVYKSNYKKAAKYYKKALKIDPDDYAATHNLKILKKQKTK
jgi:tetratricopeptide (TPR) repeat protein